MGREGEGGGAGAASRPPPPASRHAASHTGSFPPSPPPTRQEGQGLCDGRGQGQERDGARKAQGTCKRGCAGQARSAPFLKTDAALVERVRKETAEVLGLHTV